jgi:hypothetical protein
MAVISACVLIAASLFGEQEVPLGFFPCPSTTSINCVYDAASKEEEAVWATCRDKNGYVIYYGYVFRITPI